MGAPRREAGKKKAVDEMTVIREMRTEDRGAVAELERKSFSEPWSESLIAEAESSPLDRLWVLLEEENIVGYCNLRVIAGEGELMRIAVDPAARGRGLGRKLMEVLTEYAAKHQVEEITLEVRVSNEAAAALYRSFGFRIEAVRKRYYTNPVEDAFIMWRRRG